MALRYNKARLGIEAGELYVHCPQCDGSKWITAIIRPSNGFNATESTELACPLCHQTGEADKDRAAEYLADWAERMEWEHGEDWQNEPTAKDPEWMPLSLAG